jgi:hypothetical protein
MRHRHIAWVAALSLAALAPPVGAQAVSGGPRASVACTNAVIDGHHKCLQRGQFCKHGVAYQYPRYGYHCNKRDRNGRWHLT